jgi:hypothetical protein
MAAKALFDDVFNAKAIYQMLFFNIKSVLIHPTLEELREKNKPMFERWKYFSESKYNVKFFDSNIFDDEQINTYKKNAPYFPEFSRIVAITYATAYSENGSLKRRIERIKNDDEYLILVQFIEVLNILSNEGAKTQYPILCGHNIISYDIPFLIKRLIIHRDKFEVGKKVPLILKNSLNIKPWESGIIDTLNVWKFNGYDNMPLMMIADYLGLKKTVDLLPLNELSEYYWKNINEKPAETMDFILLQSATQINLVIQLMNELRQL